MYKPTIHQLIASIIISMQHEGWNNLIAIIIIINDYEATTADICIINKVVKYYSVGTVNITEVLFVT